MSATTEDIAKMIRLNMLSPTGLMFIFLWYARRDRAGLDVLLSEVKPDDLEMVSDVLGTYPQTEVGWSSLPMSREPFQRTDLDPHESEDVERRQCQEDRTHVEFLREWIRQRARE